MFFSTRAGNRHLESWAGTWIDREEKHPPGLNLTGNPVLFQILSPSGPPWLAQCACPAWHVRVTTARHFPLLLIALPFFSQPRECEKEWWIGRDDALTPVYRQRGLPLSASWTGWSTDWQQFPRVSGRHLILPFLYLLRSISNGPSNPAPESTVPNQVLLTGPEAGHARPPLLLDLLHLTLRPSVWRFHLAIQPSCCEDVSTTCGFIYFRMLRGWGWGEAFQFFANFALI